jgi:hypothetical protein
MTTETGSEQASGNPAAGGATPPAAPAAPAHWSSGIEDAELKGWVENKGFHQKDPAEVARSYRNLEKMFGADKAGRTVEIPADEKDASQWDSFYNKLGRPEKPEKYELAVPEGADPKFADWAKGTFHKLGLTTKQAKALSEGWNEYVTGQAKSQIENYELTVQKEDEALTKEWGAAKEAKIQQAKNATREFVLKAGLGKEVVDKLEDALGYGGLMRFMSAIGEKIGESTFVSGDQNAGFGAMTPGGAQAKLDDLLGDKDFKARYLSGETTAVQKVQSLQKLTVAGGKR